MMTELQMHFSMVATLLTLIGLSRKNLLAHARTKHGRTDPTGSSAERGYLAGAASQARAA